MLKPPGTKLLKVKCDILVSTSAFKFNLRRYTSVCGGYASAAANTIVTVEVGQCRLTLSNPR
jgi:hypothetical protein